MEYIHADFNSCFSTDDPKYDFIDLTGFGTIRDLNFFQIKLKDGMKFIFYEPEDIEVIGEVFFDTTHPSLFSNKGRWLSKFEKNTITQSQKKYNSNTIFPCFKCRNDLNAYFKKSGRNFKMTCPDCGESITSCFAD